MPITLVNASTASGSGNGTLTFTNEAVDDILLVVIERSTGDEIQAAPGGWTQFSFSPLNDGNSRVQYFWTRATSANEPSFAVTDGGNHFTAVAMIFRGASKATDPWDVATSGTKTVASTSISWTTGSTALDGCMLLAIVTNPTDTTVDQVSSVTLDGAVTTTRSFLASNVNNGGGVYIYYREKSQAGAIGTTSGTLVASATDCTAFLALRPALSLVHDKVPATVPIVESGGAEYILMPDYTQAPDGTVTAILAADAGTASASRNVSDSFGTGSAGFALSTIQATYSVFFKLYTPSRKWAVVRLFSNGGGGYSEGAVLDLTTGTTSLVTAGVTGAVVDSYDNGWYRLSVTLTGINTGTSSWTMLWFAPLSSTISSTHVGTPGNGFYYWAPSAVAGPYSYFEIDSGVITRGAGTANFYTYYPRRIIIT